MDPSSFSHSYRQRPCALTDLFFALQGWFQSSMFCSLVATDRTCSKAFLTHGFVVDKDGRKMSKSAGNGLSPLEIIGQYNADVLRMWVRSAPLSLSLVSSRVSSDHDVARLARCAARITQGTSCSRRSCSRPSRMTTASCAPRCASSSRTWSTSMRPR